MNAIKFVATAIALVAAFLAGCGQSTSSAPSSASTVTQPTPPAKVQIDLSTPDKALKSYWAVKDSVRAVSVELISKFDSDMKPYRKQVNAVTSEAITNSFFVVDNVFETFSRDIIKVDVESESRAVIFVVIRNTTAIPTGVKPSDDEEKRRRDGERYKYVVERDKTDWKVSEIWEWSKYFPENDWKKTLPSDRTSYTPSYTHDGI
ncbi:MAG: hypothetical protein LBI48_02060 [Burkholderiaceae bacterium]|jgi:hypothetical protein|nr:hypothetical protein [Burkholderiaceae bacterium]